MISGRMVNPRGGTGNVSGRNKRPSKEVKRSLGESVTLGEAQALAAEEESVRPEN